MRTALGTASFPGPLASPAAPGRIGCSTICRLLPQVVFGASSAHRIAVNTSWSVIGNCLPGVEQSDDRLLERDFVGLGRRPSDDARPVENDIGRDAVGAVTLS